MSLQRTPHEPMALLLRVMRDPEAIRQLASSDWDQLVRQARHADLIARLGEQFRGLGLWEEIPTEVRPHLLSAVLVSEAQHREIHYEVLKVSEAIQPLGCPIVLLKGSAYVVANLPAAMGRTMSDVDIMVPRASLADVEKSLFLSGWSGHHHHPYDQRYYREWMHELPPLQHVRRGTMLDVHHAILPLTARLRPDSRLLLEKALPVDGYPGVYMLCPADMVLHSMSHLLNNEEMTHGLRDLSDLDLLLRHHGQQPGFWDELLERSRQLGLQRMLYYGLEHTHRILGTPIPQALSKQAAAIGAPPRGVAALMNAVWSRALCCLHSTAKRPGTDLAQFVVFIRAHWLRMPMPLLLFHLGMKVWRAVYDNRIPKKV